MLGYLTCRPAGSVFSSRTIFALAGFAVAAWAPLVPHVKTGLALSHARCRIIFYSWARARFAAWR